MRSLSLPSAEEPWKPDAMQRAGPDCRNCWEGGLIRRRGQRPALHEMALAAVVDLDLQLAGFARQEGEAEARVLAERDVGIDGEHGLAGISHTHLLDEVRGDVVPRHLVHLQPGAVGMADQQL